MSSGNEKYTDSSEFALWDKYEDVAMHFNDLLIRLRTQALGALTGVVALSGFAVTFAQKAESGAQWVILFGALLFFTFAWIALGILDLFYYNQLLWGAVNALKDHEQETRGLGDGAALAPAGAAPAPAVLGAAPAAPSKTPIWLSTKISAAVPRWRWPIGVFYGLVLFGLLIGVGYTGWQAATWKSPTHEIPEYKIQFVIPKF